MSLTDQIAKRLRSAVDESLGNRGALRNCQDEIERRRRDDAAVAALARRVRVADEDGSVPAATA